MPYQGVALAVILGVGIATAAVFYFLGQREFETPHGSYNNNNRRSTPDEPESYVNPWEQSHGNHNDKRRRKQCIEQERTSCPICLEELIEDCRYLRCQHRFHNRCIDRWLRMQAAQGCPVCRKKATI